MTLLHFSSQWVAGSKALSMPLVAEQSWTCHMSVVDRLDLYRDFGAFQHRQWNKEKWNEEVVD